MSGATLTLPTPRAERAAPSRADSFVTIERSGVEWLMRADVVDELLPAVGRPAELAKAHSVETVKNGPHRTVYRLSLAGGNFYLKHFRTADARALLQNVVRPSKAEREFQAAGRIARLGLPTFEPVALGRLMRGGIVHDSFLVSREIPDAQPLDRLVIDELAPAGRPAPARQVARRQSELRQKLAVALGVLAAKLHRAAVDHADFHAANVLVGIEADGLPELWLIDLHNVRFRRALSKRERYDNLALLHQFFAGKSSRADRFRFYRAYLNEWRRTTVKSVETEPSDERSELTALERALAAGAVQGWLRADRAWRRGNRHVRTLDGAFVRCRGLATLDRDWLRTIRDDPERLFRENCVRWHKQTAKHRVAEVRVEFNTAGTSTATTAAFLKCIERKAGWRGWLAGFRESPVRRCWELGHALLRRGIDTPRPLLFIERCEPQSSRLYLLTEAIPDSLSVPDFMNERWPGLTSCQRRAWVKGHLQQLARQLRRLHDACFDHRDLKFANLLVASDPGDLRIWFLDLDGVRDWRALPRRRAVQNLARINVSSLVVDLASHSDRLRFLKLYLGSRFSSEWKSWWRGIARVSLAKIRKNRSRGRVLS
jgi:tRNA A-37 threonylcarbamoyl transferase component Bud32